MKKLDIVITFILLLGVKAFNDSGWGEDPTVNKFALNEEERNKPSNAVTEKITLTPTANDKVL